MRSKWDVFESEVRRILRTNYKVPELTHDTSLEGVDSLGLVEIITAAESELDMRLEFADARRCKTYGELRFALGWKETPMPAAVLAAVRGTYDMRSKWDVFESEVRRILRTNYKVPELTHDTSLEGVDSLGLVEIITAAESELDMQLEFADARRCKTYGELRFALGWKETP